MKPTKKWLRLGLGIALGAGLSTGASALDQTGPAPQDQAANGAPQSATKAADKNKNAVETTNLKEIKVTGVLRQVNVQKFAGSVTTLDPEDIRGVGINNSFKKIQVMVPGLNISNQEGNTEIYLRGVGSSNNTELGSPAIAPYLNGNYISRPRGLGLNFYDLQNVEVHEGPQGTGSGRNALGGTINIITKKPELGKFGGYGQIEYGNRDERGTEAAINVPLTSTSALRLATYTQDIDSDFNNAGLDKSIRPAGIRAEKDARLSYLTKPTDRLSVLLVADAGHEGGTGYPGANIYSAVNCIAGPGNAGCASPKDLNLRNVIFRGQQGKLDNHIWGFAANIDYRFDPFTVKYNGSYRSLNFNQTNAEADGINFPGRNIQPYNALTNLGGEDYNNYGNVYWQQTSKAQTHQILLQSPDDQKFVWTVGGFYSYEKQTTGYASFSDASNQYSGCCYLGAEYTMPYVRDKSSAVFADATFNVSDRFRVVGGFRYTNEDLTRKGLGGSLGIAPGGTTDPSSDNYACCFLTTIGSPGFQPALLNRPSYNVTNLTPAQQAQFLLDTARSWGITDDVPQILAGANTGAMPNGTCVDNAQSNPPGLLVGGARLMCPTDKNGGNSFLGLTLPLQQYGHEHDNFTDGRLGVQYDWADKHTVYLTVTTGHQAGGFNDTIQTDVAAVTYRPQLLVSYEMGSKNQFEFMGKQSTLNASAFLYNWHRQVFQTLQGFNFINGVAQSYSLLSQNLGESRIWGLSLHDTMLFDHGFMLGTDVLYLNTKILSGTVADPRSTNYGIGGQSSLIDLTGNKLQYSSKFTVSAHLQQYINLSQGEFDWQILGQYRSSYYLTDFNQRPVTFLSGSLGNVTENVVSAALAGFPDKQPGFYQVNLGAGYSPNDTWRVEAYVSNLFNKTVSQKEISGSGLNIRFLNDSRTYGVRLKANF